MGARERDRLFQHAAMIGDVPEFVRTWPRVSETGQVKFKDLQPGWWVPGPGLIFDVYAERRSVLFESGDSRTFSEAEWPEWGFEGVRRPYIIQEEP